MPVIGGAENYEDLLWIDIEASGLQRGSFPIEVGWCGAALEPISFLIKPIPDTWSMFDWTPSSEKIHGIGWDYLNRCGFTAADVAVWMNAACTGKTVLSDNPGFDDVWINRLFDDTGVLREFDLMDATHAAGIAAGLAGLSEGEAQSIIVRVQRRFPHPHRAAPDARRNAAEFLAVALPHLLQEIEAMA